MCLNMSKNECLSYYYDFIIVLFVAFIVKFVKY